MLGPDHPDTIGARRQPAHKIRQANNGPGPPGWPVTATVAALTEPWTAPQVERISPGRILDERRALEA